MATSPGVLGAAVLKEKQRALREGFPEALTLRVHRGISWLMRAEREEDPDVRFILLWIGFNAAYGGNIGHAVDGVGSERDAFMGFFTTLNGFDGQQRIYKAVWQRFSQEIRVLLANQYIFGTFWKHHNGEPGYADWSARLDRANVAVSAALRRQDTTTILSNPVRPALCAAQPAGAWRGHLRRLGQPRSGTRWRRLVGFLLPIFIDLMMDQPDHPWRMPHYPVVP